MAEPIKAQQVVPIEDLTKGLLQMGRDLSRRFDQARRPPPIPQIRRGNVFCAHAKQEEPSMTPSLIHNWHLPQNINRYVRQLRSW
jgi:hypothetical protein